MFLILKSHNSGRDVYINPLHIIKMEETILYQVGVFTTISLVGSQEQVLVNHKIEDIKNMLVAFNK